MIICDNNNNSNKNNIIIIIYENNNKNNNDLIFYLACLLREKILPLKLLWINFKPIERQDGHLIKNFYTYVNKGNQVEVVLLNFQTYQGNYGLNLYELHTWCHKGQSWIKIRKYLIFVKILGDQVLRNIKPSIFNRICQYVSTNGYITFWRWLIFGILIILLNIFLIFIFISRNIFGNLISIFIV